MRQVGIFAAAAAHALDHHMDDLQADHQNARTIASILAASDAIEIDPESVQTNLVIFRLAPGAADPQTVVDRAREAGVGVFAFGDGIRAVTHRDVTADECREAASVLVAAAEA